jgi:hypothetical protein
MKMPREDVLNAIVVDLVADQVVRALQLGYGRKAVEAAVARGMSHGVSEFVERRKEIRETEKLIGSFGPGTKPEDVDKAS